jgi:hypothetical protein
VRRLALQDLPDQVGQSRVPVAPYPEWSQTDTALAPMASLLRGLHDAACQFDPHGLHWNDALADPAGGTIVCHNDVELSNVVFRDGTAVALLDFEFAAPGRRVYDLAQLARLCVPIDDDFDLARLGWQPADRRARLRLVAAAYGLDQDGRAALLNAVDDAIDRIEAAVRRSIELADAEGRRGSEQTGGIEKFARRRQWWSDHKAQFAAAVLSPGPLRIPRSHICEGLARTLNGAPRGLLRGHGQGLYVACSRCRT